MSGTSTHTPQVGSRACTGPTLSSRYQQLCLSHNIEGLRQGLSHFSHPSRVSLIYAFEPDDPLCIYDPQELLRGHEPKLSKLYLESGAWADSHHPLDEHYGLIDFQSLDLTGLIAYGGLSSAITYQMWFTEQHPDMCSIGPTQRWLEHAARLLVQDIVLAHEINLGTSGYVLQGYAMHAVRDHIVDRRNVILGPDSRLRIYPLLDAVLGISRTREEGAWPHGSLVFVEPGWVDDLPFLIRFPSANRPDVTNHKHVRKLLLAVEASPRSLVSDGERIMGIAAGPWPQATLRADFHGSHGFLHLDQECVCSFSEGSFQATTRRAKLVQLEEILLEQDLESEWRHTLFQSVASIVHRAQEQKWGCTLVVDFNDQPVSIAGQHLDPPLDLTNPDNLELAKALAKMDGALHIDWHLRLHNFACLLDGMRVKGEDRSRGARFNSALRFTCTHQNIVLIVVSADRPVSVIQDGIELSAACSWSPAYHDPAQPPTLQEWIEAAPS